MNNVLKDFSYALRTLHKAPGSGELNPYTVEVNDSLAPLRALAT